MARTPYQDPPPDPPGEYQSSSPTVQDIMHPSIPAPQQPPPPPLPAAATPPDLTSTPPSTPHPLLLPTILILTFINLLIGLLTLATH